MTLGTIWARLGRSGAATLLLAWFAVSLDVASPGAARAAEDAADDFLIIDCLLPGQVRKLGRNVTYVTARRPIRTSARDCEIRGGEYVAYDRATTASSLQVWLAPAQEGDAKAQTYLGEIYEEGVGGTPDFAAAAEWYRKAAEQGYAPAMINLATLYEKGLGVPQDSVQALNWYRRASGLESVVLEEGAPAAEPSPEPVPSGAPAEGPAIEILDPTVQRVRGEAVARVRAGVEERLIVGRIASAAGILSLTLNDQELELSGEGVFKTRLAVPPGGTMVNITAVDDTGRTATTIFKLETAEPATTAEAARDRAQYLVPEISVPRNQFGAYHALVVGNNAYARLTPLDTPRADATTIAKLLSERYGFTVALLLDATRYEILAALNEMRETLSEQDNFLLYYAGHGILDEINQRGHWLPIDAEPNSSANWISNIAITDMLNAMQAMHVLVVADTCYSGTLTRSALTRPPLDSGGDVQNRWVTEMLGKRSRVAFTSGGLAPVLDAVGGQHSVFAEAFISALNDNQAVVEGVFFYHAISDQVASVAQSVQFSQVPEYAPIQFAGHESGDFFFVPVR